ncbi:MAG: RNA-binding ATPase activator esf2 [Chaenotheca gracillima]|nr:MAG: RNA-binding ATPase activator esf2 [Chaenotheca gracillima]
MLRKYRAAAQRVNKSGVSSLQGLDTKSEARGEQSGSYTLTELKNTVELHDGESSSVRTHYFRAQSKATKLLMYEQRIENLFVIEAALQNKRNIKESFEDEASAFWFYRLLSELIVPTADVLPQSEYEKADGQKLPSFHLLSYLGITSLVHLSQIKPLGSGNLSAKVICSVSIFTDLSDVWNTRASYDAACRLLTEDGGLASSTTILVDHLLRSVLKPLFANSAPSTITPAGRQAIDPGRKQVELGQFESQTKPWKYQAAWGVTVLRFVLQRMNTPLVEVNWPLLVPPVLAVLDDSSTAMKTKGARLVTRLLYLTPPELLIRTGLFPVFRDALKPCTLFLPTLTPLEESLPLLKAAYSALFALGNARFPPASDGAEPSSQTTSLLRNSKSANAEKIAFQAQVDRSHYLSAILRSCIFAAHAHCPESTYPRITTLLCWELRDIVIEMGPSTTRHLKDIIPLLIEILNNPFGTASPEMLEAAAQALKQVLLRAWARASRWRGEVLMGLVGCWMHVLDEEQNSRGRGGTKSTLTGEVVGPRIREIDESYEEQESRKLQSSGKQDDVKLNDDEVSLENVKATLKGIAGILRASLKDDVDLDIDSEYDLMISKEERLKELLD